MRFRRVFAPGGDVHLHWRGWGVAVLVWFDDGSLVVTVGPVTVMGWLFSYTVTA